MGGSCGCSSSTWFLWFTDTVMMYRKSWNVRVPLLMFSVAVRIRVMAPKAMVENEKNRDPDVQGLTKLCRSPLFSR